MPALPHMKAALASSSRVSHAACAAQARRRLFNDRFSTVRQFFEKNVQFIQTWRE